VDPARGSTDESAEPPVEYTVTVGERSVVLKDGDVGRLDGTFTDPQVKVIAKQTRVFPYQGVVFEYPRAFTFEADFSDKAAKNWTLSGNDFKITLFSCDDNLTSSEFAESMMSQFGRENCKVTNSNARITLGSHALSGTSIRITIAAHSMAMDCYRLPSRGRKTRLLVFQDSLDEVGKRSKEGTVTMDLLRKSFKLSE